MILYKIIKINNNNLSNLYFKNIPKIFSLCKTMLLTKYNQILKIQINKLNKLLVIMTSIQIDKVPKQFNKKIT